MIASGAKAPMIRGRCVTVIPGEDPESKRICDMNALDSPIAKQMTCRQHPSLDSCFRRNDTFRG